MMYHLRLTKALSYTGIVTATRKNPDVYVEDKEEAEKLTGSGFFTLLGQAEESGEPETASPQTEATIARSQLEEMELKDLKALAADMGINVTGKKKADYVEAIAAETVKPGPLTDENGSPTMIDLQQA